MNIAIIPVFGAHGVRVVGSSHVAPGMDKIIIVCGENTVAKVVEVVCGRALHGIGCPGREVAFGIGPGDSIWHGDVVSWKHEVACFGDGDEFIIIGAQPFWDKSIHEAEYAGVFPLMFAEGLEIHEEVNQRAA